jgi:hypothetical protein
MFGDLSELLFWLGVFIALGWVGGPKLVKKVRKNQFENYEDEYCEACECDPCDCGFGSY